MEKTLSCYLLANWRTGNIEVRKRRPSPFDGVGYVVPIKLSLTLSIPSDDIEEFRAKIILSEKKVVDLVVEELG